MAQITKDYIQGVEDSAELILSILYTVASLDDAKEEVKEIIGAAQRLKIDVFRVILMI